MPDNSSSHKRLQRYPPEPGERTVRMAFERIEHSVRRTGAVLRVADQLGNGIESLRQWVHQAETDGSNLAGLTTETGGTDGRRTRADAHIRD